MATHPPPPLPQLPPNKAVSKRSLLHQPIPHPTAAPKHAPKIIYVSASTPFMSAMKRIRSLLEVQSRPDNAQRRPRRSGSRKEGDERKVGGGAGAEGVLLKATGKAIDKALQLGLFFQNGAGQREGKSYRVVVRTGTVDVLDDIVDVPEGRKRKAKSGGGGDGKRKKRKGKEEKRKGGGEEEKESMEVNVKKGEKNEGEGGKEMAIRARKTSSVEIIINLLKK